MTDLFTRNRLFEWITTLMMLGIALTLVMYPHSVASTSFHYMNHLGFTGVQLFWSFTAFGSLRAVALIANGRWPAYGPLCRALGATGGAFLWFTFGLSLFMNGYDTGVISLGVPVYATLTFGEITAVFRAGTDVRYRSYAR